MRGVLIVFTDEQVKCIWIVEELTLESSNIHPGCFATWDSSSQLQWYFIKKNTQFLYNRAKQLEF